MPLGTDLDLDTVARTLGLLERDHGPVDCRPLMSRARWERLKADCPWLDESMVRIVEPRQAEEPR